MRQVSKWNIERWRECKKETLRCAVFFSELCCRRRSAVLKEKEGWRAAIVASTSRIRPMNRTFMMQRWSDNLHWLEQSNRDEGRKRHARWQGQFINCCCPSIFRSAISAYAIHMFRPKERRHAAMAFLNHSGRLSYHNIVRKCRQISRRSKLEWLVSGKLLEKGWLVRVAACCLLSLPYRRRGGTSDIGIATVAELGCISWISCLPIIAIVSVTVLVVRNLLTFTLECSTMTSMSDY